MESITAVTSQAALQVTGRVNGSSRPSRASRGAPIVTFGTGGSSIGTVTPSAATRTRRRGSSALSNRFAVSCHHMTAGVPSTSSIDAVPKDVPNRGAAADVLSGPPASGIVPSCGVRKPRVSLCTSESTARPSAVNATGCSAFVNTRAPDSDSAPNRFV